ncbi:hypothetical protein F5144DRAFT_625689 [Chaetomium tenue]|uniref:Uncharacterized protein n=1 Tax=Chaetomium tenue TaxID=1854479 RepID=A0ACB7PRJ8_9PEZI|nr:hypothetical protein F5144DRAFT_625689 [Chaetomium globosum]
MAVMMRSTSTHLRLPVAWVRGRVLRRQRGFLLISAHLLPACRLPSQLVILTLSFSQNKPEFKELQGNTIQSLTPTFSVSITPYSQSSWYSTHGLLGCRMISTKLCRWIH